MRTTVVPSHRRKVPLLVVTIVLIWGLHMVASSSSSRPRVACARSRLLRCGRVRSPLLGTIRPTLAHPFLKTLSNSHALHLLQLSHTGAQRSDLVSECSHIRCACGSRRRSGSDRRRRLDRPCGQSATGRCHARICDGNDLVRCARPSDLRGSKDGGSRTSRARVRSRVRS